MVRSLSQWTKTLSFPNRHSKECNVNVHPIQAPPTPARNKSSGSLSSPSSSPPSSPQNVNVPITEISQIVSWIKTSSEFSKIEILTNKILSEISITTHFNFHRSGARVEQTWLFNFFSFAAMKFRHEKNVKLKLQSMMKLPSSTSLSNLIICSAFCLLLRFYPPKSVPIWLVKQQN